MPLDPYIDNFTRAADYAEDILIQPCMAPKGFTWPVIPRDTGASTGTTNAAGITLFNVTVAEKWGYHSAINDNATSQELLKLNSAPMSDAENAAFDSCLASVRAKQLPLPSIEVTNAGSVYYYDAVSKAQSSNAVMAAAKRWVQCMAPVGVSDLPSSPDKMPSASLIQEFGELVPGTQPSADELRVATADAKCRDSSGYAKTLYDAEWKDQVAQLSSNADELQRDKTQLDAYRAKVFAVISQYAPQASN